MGKMTWNVKGAEVDAVEQQEQVETFEPYEGPIPPNNSVLLVGLKWARVAEFGSGNGGLRLLMEVSEPDGPKSRYNGCPLFENLVDVDTQDWKIRQFLDAIGATGKDWDNCVSETDGNNEVITKFGRVKADGLTLRVQTEIDTYDGEKRAKVRKYLPKVTGAASGKKATGSKAKKGTTSDEEPPF
jgi:hypothetical protein